MKLLRWAVAGASVYAVYKYSIGRKAKGEDVFVSPEKAIADLTNGEAEAEPEEESPKPAAKKASARKPRPSKAASK